MSWWSDVKFDIHDFFTTSDVEAQCKQYRKLVEYLDWYLPELKQQIELCEKDGLPISPGADDTTSRGGLADEYSRCYDSITNRFDRLIATYNSYYILMVRKQALAKLKLEKYEKMVRIENQRKREMSRQEQRGHL